MKTRPPLWYTVQAILGALVEEAALVAIVLWLLPRFNIHIPLWGLAIMMVALATHSYVMYRVGSPTFMIKPKVAPENIVGCEGTVVKPLNPQGCVKVQGVLWKATCAESELEIGDEIIVVGIEGLKLIVRPKQKISGQKAHPLKENK